jgi:hypothetical protein
MAWTDRATPFSGNSKTSGNQLTFTMTLALGDVAIAVISSDNVQTTDGQTSLVSSINDPKANTWTKIVEFTNGQGSAGGGATVSLWVLVCTVAAINATNTQTINFASTVTAKAVTGQTFGIGAGATVTLVGTAQTLASDAADPAAQSVSGLASREYLFVRGMAMEAAVTALTTTASYTSPGTAGTSGGSAATNMQAGMEYRILTGTGDTSNPTWAANDGASVYVALKEAAAGTQFNQSCLATTTPTKTDTEKLIRAISAQANAASTLRAVRNLNKVVNANIASAVQVVRGITNRAQALGSGAASAVKRASRTLLGSASRATSLTASRVTLVSALAQAMLNQAELITNGTFDVDLTGWTGVGAFGTYTWVAGWARLTPNGIGNMVLSQPITTVAGQVYQVDFDCRRVTADPILNIGTTEGNTDIFYSGAIAPGHYSVQFTALGTTTWITLSTNAYSGGPYSEFDNVSVKLSGPGSSKIALVIGKMAQVTAMPSVSVSRAISRSVTVLMNSAAAAIKRTTVAKQATAVQASSLARSSLKTLQALAAQVTSRRLTVGKQALVSTAPTTSSTRSGTRTALSTSAPVSSLVKSATRTLKVSVSAIASRVSAIAKLARGSTAPVASAAADIVNRVIQQGAQASAGAAASLRRASARFLTSTSAPATSLRRLVSKLNQATTSVISSRRLSVGKMLQAALNIWSVELLTNTSFDAGKTGWTVRFGDTYTDQLWDFSVPGQVSQIDLTSPDLAQVIPGLQIGDTVRITVSHNGGTGGAMYPWVAGETQPGYVPFWGGAGPATTVFDVVVQEKTSDQYGVIVGNGPTNWVFYDISVKKLVSGAQGSGFLSRAVGKLLNTAATPDNMISNGTFDADASNWVALNFSALSVVGGRLRVTDDGQHISVAPGAGQGVPTVVGRRYRLVYDLYAGTTPAGNGYVQIGSSPGGSEINALNTLGAGQVYEFTAVSATTYIAFVTYQFSGWGTYIEADNVSMREVGFASLVRAATKLLQGSTGPQAVATLVKALSQRLSASASAQASITLLKSFRSLLSAQTAPTAALRQAITKLAQAQVQTAASLLRAASIRLLGTAATANRLLRSVTKKAQVSTAPASSLVKSMTKTSLAQAGGAAALVRAAALKTQAQVISAAALLRAMVKTLRVSSAPQGSVVKSTVKTALAQTAPTKTFSAIRVVLLSAQAQASTISSSARSIGVKLIAQASVTTSSLRAMVKKLTSSTPPSGTAQRAMAKSLSTSTAPAATSTARQVVNLAAQAIASGVGTVRTAFAVLRQGTVSTQVFLRRASSITLRAMTGAVGRMTKGFSTRLQALTSTESVATLLKSLSQKAQAVVGASPMLIRGKQQVSRVSATVQGSIRRQLTKGLLASAVVQARATGDFIVRITAQAQVGVAASVVTRFIEFVMRRAIRWSHWL